MNRYLVTGLNAPTCLLVAKAFRSISQLTSDPFGRVTLEAHSASINAITRLAENLDANVIDYSCWKRLDGWESLIGGEFKQLRSAVVISPKWDVHIYCSDTLPSVDWDGGESRDSNVSFAWKANDSNAHPDTVLTDLGAILREEYGVLKIKTTLVMNDCSTEHRFMITVPTVDASSLVRRVGMRLGIIPSIGSFTFYGCSHDIATIAASGLYLSTGYPGDYGKPNVRNGGVPFSIASNSMVHPIPNVRYESLDGLASAIDDVGAHLFNVSIIKRYVSWKLRSRMSRRVTGNGIYVTRGRRPYCLSISYDQYDDHDPSAKEFTASVRPDIESHGWKLKGINCIP